LHGGLFSPAPLQALNSAAGNKNQVNQAVIYALIASAYLTTPEQPHII
jgi:hypothetical protein